MLALKRAAAGVQTARPRRAGTLIQCSSSGATPAELQQFLVERHGFRQESVARLLLDKPEVTKCSIETRIAPLCHFLLELGCTPAQMELMVFK